MSDGDLLRFTVDIIHRNGAEHLTEALSGFKQAIDPARDEIIVIDNASTYGSLEPVLTRHAAVQAIRNDCNAGYTRTINQTLSAGRGCPADWGYRTSTLAIPIHDNGAK